MPPLTLTRESDSATADLRRRIAQADARASDRRDHADRLVADLRVQGVNPAEDAEGFRRVDAAYAEVDQATEEAAALRRQLDGIYAGRELAGGGEHLHRDVSLADSVRANSPAAAAAGENLSLARLLRGVLTSRWDGAEAEVAQMGTTPGGAGGFLVPELLSAEVLDLARARARVIQAGARVFPILSNPAHVARLEGDPQAGWRNEHAVIVEGNVTVGRMTFMPKSLAVLVKTSLELLEDALPTTEEVVRDAIAASIAVELDRVALLGSGVAPQPRGLRNTPGVHVMVLGTGNGARPTWNDLVAAAGAVDDANHTPGAFIMAPRTNRTLTTLEDADGNPRRIPATVEDLPRLTTTQVPTNRVLGTSNDVSDVYVGEWPLLFFGVRTQLVISPLVERFADTGQVAFVGWVRADMQVARPSAFTIIEGIRP